MKVRSRNGRAMLAVSGLVLGGVLAIFGALVVAATAMTFANGRLFTVLFLLVAVLAGILGTALGFGLAAVVLGTPVLVLAGAAWIVRKGWRKQWALRLGRNLTSRLPRRKRRTSKDPQEF